MGSKGLNVWKEKTLRYISKILGYNRETVIVSRSQVCLKQYSFEGFYGLLNFNVVKVIRIFHSLLVQNILPLCTIEGGGEERVTSLGTSAWGGRWATSLITIQYNTIIYLTTLTSKSTKCSFKIRTCIKLSKIHIHMKY